MTQRSPSIAIASGIACCGEAKKPVGFAVPDTDAELVVHLNLGPETGVLVEDVDDAALRFVGAGGEACSLRSTSPLADAPGFATPSATN